MYRSPDDTSEREDIGLSELPGQEDEVGVSLPRENGFPGPKRLPGSDYTAGLKGQKVLYKTNDGDPIKCNGDFARLTINMTVMHIRKHPSFKYYTEREDFNENLTVSQSSEKMGLWFVTTIFSVINIRKNNFNETFYLVYKDTKDVIIFDESVICNESISKVTVGSISKGNKTPVVVPTVIVLAVIVALFVLFGWYFRKKIIQCCRGASFHHSKANGDNTVNGEGRNLMNTTGLQNDSGVAENQNKSEANGKILDEAKSPPTEQVNLQDI
ncbi:uncharacterized protein LOC127706612 [Mytilus californianus]|uniref:uncharacterized protein LOC127706612 n=1 Tax=Mytilus californianus TaxID=6549 RepID=UPI002246BEF7|nr:uncharacterized protein LOC127706612 [Mytilus californianus]